VSHSFWPGDHKKQLRHAGRAVLLDPRGLGTRNFKKCITHRTFPFWRAKQWPKAVKPTLYMPALTKEKNTARFEFIQNPFGSHIEGRGGPCLTIR